MGRRGEAGLEGEFRWGGAGRFAVSRITPHVLCRLRQGHATRKPLGFPGQPIRCRFRGLCDKCGW